MSKIRSGFTTAAIIAGACAMAASATTVQAAGAKDFYKGKTVRILVPYGAGGGYDTYARIMAPHFAKYLNATVIVQNKPGAGGLIGLNQVYAGKKDGTELVFFQGTSAAATQIVGAKNARFDLLKMGLIATVAWSPWLLLVEPKSKVKTIDDLKNFGKVISFGGNGVMSADTTGGRLVCMSLRLKCKAIVGYKGSRAASLALTRGEIDAYYVSDSSAYKYVKAKAAKPVVIFGPTKSIFFPDVKSIFDVAKVDERGKWLIAYHNNLESIGRILAGPPGIPADRLALLRKMAEDVLTDPKFVAEAKSKKRDILFSDAAKTEKAVKAVLSISPERKKLATTLITGK